jgi:hypothetical protein
MMTAWGNARRIARRTARGNASAVSARAQPGGRLTRLRIVAADLACLGPCRSRLVRGRRPRTERRAEPAAGRRSGKLRSSPGYDRGRRRRLQTRWRASTRGLHVLSPTRPRSALWSEAFRGPRGRESGRPLSETGLGERKPRTMSETRTCIGTSGINISCVSRASIQPAASASSSRGRRRRPSGGRPRRATWPHTPSGQDPAGDPDRCRPAGGTPGMTGLPRSMVPKPSRTARRLRFERE